MIPSLAWLPCTSAVVGPTGEEERREALGFVFEAPTRDVDLEAIENAWSACTRQLERPQ